MGIRRVLMPRMSRESLWNHSTTLQQCVPNWSYVDAWFDGSVSFAEISIECFEKSKKKQPLLPLQSLKNFKILYSSRRQSGSRPSTAVSKWSYPRFTLSRPATTVQASTSRAPPEAASPTPRGFVTSRSFDRCSSTNRPGTTQGTNLSAYLKTRLCGHPLLKNQVGSRGREIPETPRATGTGNLAENVRAAGAAKPQVVWTESRNTPAEAKKKISPVPMKMAQIRLQTDISLPALLPEKGPRLTSESSDEDE